MRSFLFVACLALTACPPPPAPDTVPGEADFGGETVVTVDGIAITDKFVDAVLAPLPPRDQERLRQEGQKKRFLEQLALQQVVYRKALAEGIHKDPEVQLTLAIAQRDALARHMMRRVAEAATSDEALRKLYDERAEQYKKPQAKARHILVKTSEEAQGIYDELKGGADFAELAKAKSTDKGSGARGGDLGWFDAKRMVPQFSEAVFGAEGPGLLAPVESQFGFHVIEVLEKRDATPFDEVKDSLKGPAQQQAAQAYFESVKAEATFEWPGESTEETPAAPPAEEPKEAPAE